MKQKGKKNKLKKKVMKVKIEQPETKISDNSSSNDTEVIKKSNKYKRSIPKKIFYAILICIILSIIGAATYFIQIYLNTPKQLTKKYIKELGEEFSSDLNIFYIEKYNVYGDEKEDYICFINKNYISDKMYGDVQIQIVDGNTREVITYDTNKNFAEDYQISVIRNNEQNYIFLQSEEATNVSILTIQDGQLHDLIKENFSDVPKGYYYSYSVNNEENKIVVTLDKNGVPYLDLNNNVFEYNLDNLNVDLSLYRKSYLKEKYNYYEFGNINTENQLELVGIQNILYLNEVTTENIPNTIGKIRVTFVVNGNKITFKNVEIII